ncbi:MAG TPA: flagellar biosynthetic protein FliO [Stellaceae bacterium]|nr:flagellar biosynthetic protein FliO [Stellaceae bacterium]
MFDLFGPEIPLAAKFFIAFAVVLALIGLTAWLVRRFGSSRLGGTARGRQPRLAVIDAAAVDGRRRLVLIRRDNIEHLLMIGGPTDLVVEPNIVRAVGARELTREPARPVAGEPATRQSGPIESSWPLQPSSEPSPIAAARPFRSSATEEPWLAPEPPVRARPADTPTGMSGELSARLTPPEVPAPPAATARSEPAPRPGAAPAVPPPPLEAPPPPQTDHNLAEMAQQLEAALRRSPLSDARPPVTDPLAASAKAAPMRETKPRVEPKVEIKRETKIEIQAEPKPDPKAEAAAAAKKAFDSLEEEMANLLGRPSGKT